LLEPGVVGVWRPVLLLPAGIEQRLTPRQLEAVLAHELCHVRRRDNLTSAIHMVVEAAFWFHPLVWFIGARLVDERERACDEYVLRVCGEPRIYAESILNVCKLYVESPIACVSGVSGLASPKPFFGGGGSDLRKRVAAILVNRVGLQLSVTRKLTLAIAAVLAIVLPLAAGMLIAPVGAQSPTPLFELRRGLAGAQGAKADSPVNGAGTTAQGLKFEVASIKPCEPVAGVDFDRRGGRGAAGPAQAAEPAGASVSTGRLFLHCETLEVLIAQAYFGEASRHSYVTGGATWIKSDRYDIEAKAEGAPSDAVLRGPMLRALLEDRFKLTLHRETRDMPVYALTRAQSGSKLSPLPEGSCPPAKGPTPAGATGKADPHGCGTISVRYDPSGNQLDAHGMTIGEFVTILGGYAGLDRPVVDKTALTGVFDFHLRYVRDSAPVEADAGPSIFRAVQEQLGLRLEAGKAPGEFLVIDHVEKPRPDNLAPARATSAAAEVPGLSIAVGTVVPTAGQASAPRFDVVSIKPCDPKAPFTRRGDPPPRGFRAGGAPYQAYVSPGSAYWDCVTLAQLVDQAYVDQEHPLLNIVDQPRQNAMVNQPRRVRGGPAWVEVDKFAIEAKASPDVTGPGLAGGSGKYLPKLPEGLSLALRAVLEDRFRAKVHRATEQQDMYALTIAPSGLNKKTVTVPVPGDCLTIAEYSAAVSAGQSPDAICGRAFSSMERGMEYSSFTLQQLAHDLSMQLDHFVLDRTGVETKFNFAIKAESAPEGDGARYARALAALGLKLEPTKGPAEYLVIDSVERPKPNGPEAAPLARASGPGR
jgi:uncharacterized protein (TIGR03435 family)